MEQLRWPIKEFSDLCEDEVVKSPAFQAAGQTWRLFLSRGDMNDDQRISLYLQAEDAKRQPDGWRCRVEFRLAVVNHVDKKRSIIKESSHMFHGSKWGWKKFALMQELCSARKGFIRDDTIIVTATVRAGKPQPVASALHNSKEETGFVGLEGKGCGHGTASLLLALFHIPCFRRAVLHVPVDELNNHESRAMLELQCLFYRLQHQVTSVDVGPLVALLKDGGCLSFENVVGDLLHNIDTYKMRNTIVEGTVHRLFTGQWFTCTSSEGALGNSISSFTSVELDVEGCRDVYESLDRLTAQILGGGNEVAGKRIAFASFPPVLLLTLKRLKSSRAEEVIRDRYEYPLELDLDVNGRKYLTEDFNASVRNLYELHSVIVHHGEALWDAYSAFIRPGLGDAWFKFDDDRVTRETAHAAIEGQYGGGDETSRAHVLVYVRKSDKERICCPVREEDVAHHLRGWLRRQMVDQQKLEDDDPHMTVRVATHEDLRKQVGTTCYVGLVDHRMVRAICVAKQMPFRAFQELVARDLHVPVGQQRLWTWAKGANGAMRVKDAIPLRDSRPMSALADHHRELDLFLEPPVEADPGEKMTPSLGSRRLLIFLKAYDPVKNELRYVGQVTASSKNKVADLWARMRQLAGYAPDAPLQVYEEVAATSEVTCEQLEDDQATLLQCQIETGAILCFQKVLEPTEAIWQDCPAFFKHAATQRFVRFRQLARPKEDSFVLPLVKVSHHYRVVTAVALQLQKIVEKDAGKKHSTDLMAHSSGVLAASRIQLTRHNCYVDAPCRHPIKNDPTSLTAMLAHGDESSDILYYDVTGATSDAALASSDVTTDGAHLVSVHDFSTRTVALCHVLLSSPGWWADVAIVLSQVRAEPDCASLGELVFTKVHGGRIYKVLEPDEVLDSIEPGYWSLHVEEIAEKDAPMPPGATLIPVSHVRRDKASASNNVVTAFGHPFVLPVGEGEALASVKSRVRSKLGVAEEEFAMWRFAIVVGDTFAAYLDDDDAVDQRYRAAQAGGWDAWLGIEHCVEPRSNPRKRSREEGKEPAPQEAVAEQRLAPRMLYGLKYFDALSLETFVESSKLPEESACADLQQALAWRASDIWQLAKSTQQIGRALWASVMLTTTLRRDLRAADEEGQRLSQVCQNKEAVLLRCVADARANPLDGAALSARDKAVEDHLGALRRLEDCYGKKAELSGERVEQRRKLQAASGSPDAMSVDGEDRPGRAQGEGEGEAGDIKEAVNLAGDVMKECNEQLMPAAKATKAAMERLAQCLARQQAVAEGLKEKLDKARGAGAVVVGRAIQAMEGETPDQDAEQARVMQGMVEQKRQQLADVVALRKGLQPTEVRLGMLQRDLRDVKKLKVNAKAGLEMAELDDKHKEAAALRSQLVELEGREKEMVAALNKLTVEAEADAARLVQLYPEAAALPELANRLSKALPSRSDVSVDIIDPDWSLARFRNGIGRPLGGFRVRLVEDQEGTPWVIKELCHERQLRREGGRLQALRHPLVIRLERIFFDGGHAYLQMPYCKNGSLRAWFERIKARTRDLLPLTVVERQQVWATMKQVFQAVAFIHRKGVVHRDLKPENILLQDDGQIALCDFGVSHDVSRAFQTTLATQAGGFTTAYAAPEVLSSQPSAKQWPFTQDLWSLGVMLLELLTGTLPLWNRATGRLEDVQGRPVAPDLGGDGPLGDPWATALRALASALLRVDPAERPSCEDAFNDPCGFLARDLSQAQQEQGRRMHALSSFLESLRRCPARVGGRSHLVKVTDLDDRLQLMHEVLEGFQADGLDLRNLFSVECGGIRVPLSEVLDRFFQGVVLPEAGLFEQGREGREDVLPASQLQEGVAFLPRKAAQGAQAKRQNLDRLRCVGRVLAKAVLECLHVPVRFATAVCCFLVGDEQLADATPPRCLELMAEFDPVVAAQMRSVLAMMHGNGQEHGMMASMLTRCAGKDDYAITDANKGAVIQQAVQRRLVADRREELGALREGFLSLDDLMVDHLKLMTGEVMVTLFFSQDYLDVDKVVAAFVFPDKYWGSARTGRASVRDWLQRFVLEVSETGLRLLCLRALGSVDAFQSGHKCVVLPGGQERDLPTFAREMGCMYVPEGCQDYTIFQSRMHRALRAGEYGVRTDAQQEERLAREEMDAVVGAMRGQVRAGGWYRCPNGHPYAIGECGGAMEEARCPTCGGGIGGQQHRLRVDNQNALDIDGADAPAWN